MIDCRSGITLRWRTAGLFDNLVRVVFFIVHDLSVLVLRFAESIRSFSVLR